MNYLRDWDRPVPIFHPAKASPYLQNARTNPKPLLGEFAQRCSSCLYVATAIVIKSGCIEWFRRSQSILISIRNFHGRFSLHVYYNYIRQILQWRYPTRKARLSVPCFQQIIYIAFSRIRSCSGHFTWIIKDAISFLQLACKDSV